jgi:DNA-binding HxlR family transcriptional regulator
MAFERSCPGAASRPAAAKAGPTDVDFGSEVDGTGVRMTARARGSSEQGETVFEDPWVAPGYEVLQGVVDKWAPLVLCALRKSPKHYGELQRALGTVSKKMLTQTLRKLEQYGLVERRAQPSVPPTVEYALTALGESLTVPLEGVFMWGEQHFKDMVSGDGGPALPA